MSNLPNDFKQKLYVHVGNDFHNKGNIFLYLGDRTSDPIYGAICVGVIDAELDLSAFSFDTTKKQIEALKAQRVKIIAEHHQAIKHIDDQVQSLQAIESK